MTPLRHRHCLYPLFLLIKNLSKGKTQKKKKITIHQGPVAQFG